MLSQTWRALRCVTTLCYRCKSSMIFMCDATGMMVFATHMPLAATAGVPTPGNTESPQQNMLSSGLTALGSAPAIVSRFLGPYVPCLRRRKRACDLGLPTKDSGQALVDVWDNLQTRAVNEAVHKALYHEHNGPDQHDRGGSQVQGPGPR